MKMNVKVNVKRTFKVNGKEYGSVREMPEELCEAYEKAMGGSPKEGHGTIPSPAAKIIFNGQESENLEAMPHDVRQTYESVMKAVETGEVSPEILAGTEIAREALGQEGKRVSVPGNASRPIVPESSFSPRKLIIALMLLILLYALYYLLHGGSR